MVCTGYKHVMRNHLRVLPIDQMKNPVVYSNSYIRLGRLNPFVNTVNGESFLELAGVWVWMPVKFLPHCHRSSSFIDLLHRACAKNRFRVPREAITEIAGAVA